MPQLLVTLPDGRMVKHNLGTEAKILGRDSGCDLMLDDPSASRRHARFVSTPQGYVVEDLGSKNGTLVNDRLCSRQLLKEGDRVQIGSSLVVFSSAATTSGYSVVIAEDVTASHATRYVSRDQKLELSRQRLQAICELTGRLTRLQNRDELLEGALDICFETFGFERGAIGLRRPDQRGVDWPVVRHLLGQGGELAISRTLLNRALEHSERAIFAESDLAAADPTVSMVQHGIRSAMCVPLLHQDDVLGVLYGDRVRTAASYSAEDIDFLAAIAQQVSIGLVNARLLEEQRRMARLNRDIEVARRIQTGLFPAALPQRGPVRVAALNEPGQQVSGDYYDVLEGRDGSLWCLVADVTGEGVSAALVMANLQAAVRLTISDSNDPGELLTRWNRLVYSNTDASKFVTCLLARLDPPSRRICLASAGHSPPMLIRAGAADPEEPSPDAGFPLGVVKDAHYVSSTIDPGPEPFVLFCYTDGVVEAMDTQGALFGRQRLVESFTDRRDLNPQALIRQIRQRISHFVGSAPQSDDITMLAVRLA